MSNCYNGYMVNNNINIPIGVGMGNPLFLRAFMYANS